MTDTQLNQSNPGLGQIGKDTTQVSENFAAQLAAALSQPLLYVPKAFETWMADRVAVAGLDIPIGQIVGFSQVMNINVIATQESTGSTTYTDMTTGGPDLTLPDGTYLILWACNARNTTSGASAQAALQVNGTITGDPLQAGGISEFLSVARFAVVTLNAGGSNDVAVKYRQQGGGSAEFFARSLIALKQSNA